MNAKLLAACERLLHICEGENQDEAFDDVRKIIAEAKAAQPVKQRDVARFLYESISEQCKSGTFRIDKLARAFHNRSNVTTGWFFDVAGSLLAKIEGSK